MGNVKVCKAKNHDGQWIFGYPFVKGGIAYIMNDGVEYEIDEATLCYPTGAKDIDDFDLYVGDIIDDFGNGEYALDKEHPNYDPGQAFPPLKKIPGSDERLCVIVWEDGRIAVYCPSIGYSYNIAPLSSPLNKTKYRSNIHDVDIAAIAL